MLEKIEKLQIVKETFPGELLAKELGYEIPCTGHVNKKLRLTESVQISAFKLANPNTLNTNELKNQTRNKGINATNLREIKSEMEAKERLDYPIYSTVDPLTNVETVESGHHRVDNAKSLNWGKIPVWEVEYGARLDKLDTREEFLQTQNSHPAELRHNEDDGLRYLNKLKNNTEFFKEALQNKDEKKRLKKIKALAHERLKEHYFTYTHQKRGGIVKRFLGGVTTSKLSSKTSQQARDYFEKNNHLDKISKYDFSQNAIDFIFQAQKEDPYVGSLEANLRREMLKLEKRVNNGDMADLAISDPKVIRDRFKQGVYIRIGAYVNVNGIDDFCKLQNRRNDCLAYLKDLNLDTIFSPHTLVREVMFTPQSLVPPEGPGVIHYEWDSAKQNFYQK